MNNLKIVGPAMPDMPWEDRPAGSKEVMWRYSDVYKRQVMERRAGECDVRNVARQLVNLARRYQVRAAAGDRLPRLVEVCLLYTSPRLGGAGVALRAAVQEGPGVAEDDRGGDPAAIQTHQYRSLR